MQRAYVFNLALDVEDGLLVGGGVEVGRPSHPLVLPDVRMDG